MNSLNIFLSSGPRQRSCGYQKSVASGFTIPSREGGGVYQEEFLSLTFYPSYRVGFRGVCGGGDGGEPFPSKFTQ